MTFFSAGRVLVVKFAAEI